LRATPYRRSKAQLPYSADNIRVVMNNGWLTLEGNVEWNYQKERAEEAVRHVRGVKGVTNLIGIKPQVTASEVKRKIEQALKRSAEVDASRITVEANAGEVTLKGTVRSWAEREAAERAAWLSPRVTKVNNEIAISL